jgi:hypothetical protein
MEKRDFTRVPFETKAVISWEGHSATGMVENLSLKGLFLKTSEKVEDDREVSIKIFLTGSSSKLSIDLDGSVLRSENEGLAIKFKKIDIDSFIHLKNVVSYNQGDADEIMNEFFNYISRD